MAVFAMEARWVVRSFVSMGLKAVCRVPRPHHHLQVAVHSLLDVSKVDRRRELVVVMAVEESQPEAAVASRSLDCHDKAAHGAAGYAQMSGSASSASSASADEAEIEVHRQVCQPAESGELCVARTVLAAQEALLGDSCLAVDADTAAQEDTVVSAQGLLSPDDPALGTDILAVHPGQRMEWEDVGTETAREQAWSRLEIVNHAGTSSQIAGAAARRVGTVQVSDRAMLGEDTDVAAMAYARWIRVVLATGEDVAREDTRDNLHIARDSAVDETDAAAAAAAAAAGAAVVAGDVSLARQRRCCSRPIANPS
jgi:hypothetical protein